MTAKMAQLTARLESVQDKIFDYIERGSTRLIDQLNYWELVRKEQVLLHLARKHGLSKVGLQPVPSLAVTEGRAKHAIEMTMVINSLLLSPFAKEEWTMQETSRERWIADPEYTLKKNGMQVDIAFDGTKENSVRQTHWGNIYFQDSNGEWQKRAGEIDSMGLFYRDYDEHKKYYVNFKQLARRYSNTGRYQVYVNDNLIADIVISGVDFPKPTPAIGPGYKASPSPRRRGRGGATDGRRGRHTSPISTSSRTPAATRARSRSRSRSRTDGNAPGGPPTPGEVGTSHTLAPRRGGSRLRTLLQEARDPPGLVLTGTPNGVKCLRFRLNNRFGNYFDRVSSTWWWTGAGGERAKDASIFVLFQSDSQRKLFLERVPLPSSVKVTEANMFL